MWSAATDPRVLAARAVHVQDVRRDQVTVIARDARRLLGHGVEHLLIERGGEPIRIDVVAGTTTAGPFVLHFDIADDAALEARLTEIRRFRSPPGLDRHHQLARRLLALHAADARSVGASLRETGVLLLGPGDWPGDGEHRKSLVRRLIVAGERMVCDGPRAVLGDQIVLASR